MRSFLIALALLVAVAVLAGAPGQSAAAPSSADVYAWGFGGGGELGNGGNANSSMPGPVSLPTGVTASNLSAGASYNLALTSSGDVYGWGTDITGEHDTPVKVSLPTGMSAAGVSAGTGLAEGTSFSLIVTTSGAVYGWGNNGNGELGDGTDNPSPTPVEASLPPGVTATAAAAGGNHALALTSTGDIYAWGYNHSGQLGDGDRNPSNTPVRVSLPAGITATQVSASGDDSLALTSDGVYGWGRDYGNFTSVPIKIDLPDGVGARAVATGSNGGVVLASSGAVYALQGTTPVQVPFPDGVAIEAVAAGDRHNLALTGTGSVYAWGSNTAGQLGDGTTNDSPTPVLSQLPAGVVATGISAGGQHSLALTPRASGFPFKLVFVTQPSGGIAGSPFATQPAVAVEDTQGDIVSTDTSQVTLSITLGTGAPQAELSCDANPVSASAGVASFMGCSIAKVGTGYTLHATDGTLTAADSAPFDITPIPAAKLVFVTQPSGGTAGSPLATQPAVAIEDARGDVVSTDASVVNLSITPGSGPQSASLRCDSNALPASAGIARFTRCTIDRDGSGYRLRATDGGLTPVDSDPIDIASSLDHGRSLVGVVGDQPPFAVGDSALNAGVPEAGKTVSLLAVDGNGGRVYSAVAVTDRFGGYRFDRIPVQCSSAVSGSPGRVGRGVLCFVSVADSPPRRVPIEDSRQVVLGNDPSTTVQDLDWGHVADRHALDGVVVGPPGLPDPRVSVVFLSRNGQVIKTLGQTPAQHCNATARGCPDYRWRLEDVLATSDERWVPAGARQITVAVELSESDSTGHQVPIDSVNMQIPVDRSLQGGGPGGRGIDLHDPIAVAHIDSRDLTAPTLQSN